MRTPPRELLTDEVMCSLVGKYPAFPSEPQGVYAALLRAVIGQQISNRAARTIRQRIDQEIGLSADRLLVAPTQQLRFCGLSPRKLESLRVIAQMEAAGEFDELTRLEQSEIAERLVRISGVGPWTVDMVLIFGLHKLDIWPIKDHGLVTAARAAYGAAWTRDIAGLGERFRPFRTLAAWYLWRSLEN
jgi:DNA-3-methyladenine glycosylase II